VDSLYREEDAKAFITKYATYSRDLALRVYTSRLIGSDRALVLHGGGNSSVKQNVKNIVGEEQEVLFVKGSGLDLAEIEPQGFVGLDLSFLRKLRSLESLSDREMDTQFRIHMLTWPSPNPSVEALLHAFLQSKFIDHTHADSILILTNQKGGEALVREALGPKVAVLPYAAPGFHLAKAVAKQREKEPDIEAIVVSGHGIFSFGGDARTSYERMIHYVNKAEFFIRKRIRGKPLTSPRSGRASDEGLPLSAAARVTQTLRGACAYATSGRSSCLFLAEVRSTPELIDASLSPEARAMCASGVLTPDHVIRTKNRMVHLQAVPETDEGLREMVTGEVENFKEDYHRYFRVHSNARGVDPEELDPYPRVFLVAGLGLVALGTSRKAARIAADISEQNVLCKLQAGVLGEYVPISESHIFDVEYWSLQQRKLGTSSSLPLQGRAALITGGGGAIGYGIADRLLFAGAVVALADIDEPSLKSVLSALAEKYGEDRLETICFDVTDPSSVEEAFDDISLRLGGIDIVVPNAGTAHVSKIEDLDPDRLDQVIAVNLKGTFNTIKASIPVFKRQGTGGNIVVISSKNVFDPGAAFGAYSASKAGAHQMSKIAAIELAELGVRVNMINPDAIFGDEKIPSKLWELVGPERMKSRGLDYEGLKEYYRSRNLLKAQVLAEHVGNAVVFFSTNQTPTTGAALPVDGGIPGAFPR
jgi:rhamnose utilization protein RhaD (predicted bifunctional aldolase and dehydrogenase)/NAD(P)-dependent dehydrogenase (short-subunit alcohol dehydrogenase family)